MLKDRSVSHIVFVPYHDGVASTPITLGQEWFTTAEEAEWLRTQIGGASVYEYKDPNGVFQFGTDPRRPNVIKMPNGAEVRAGQAMDGVQPGKGHFVNRSDQDSNPAFEWIVDPPTPPVDSSTSSGPSFMNLAGTADAQFRASVLSMLARIVEQVGA